MSSSAFFLSADSQQIAPDCSDLEYLLWLALLIQQTLGSWLKTKRIFNTESCSGRRFTLNAGVGGHICAKVVQTHWNKPLVKIKYQRQPMPNSIVASAKSANTKLYQFETTIFAPFHRWAWTPKKCQTLWITNTDLGCSDASSNNTGTPNNTLKHLDATLQSKFKTANAAFKCASLCCYEFVYHWFVELLSINSPLQTILSEKQTSLGFKEWNTFCFGGKFHKQTTRKQPAKKLMNSEKIQKQCVVVQLSRQTPNWWSKLHTFEKRQLCKVNKHEK